MIRYGTDYGGWNLPEDIQLDSTSIVYSAGVGEDISFDILLQSKYNTNIVLIDPTKRSIKHFQEIKDFYSMELIKFSGDIQTDYIKTISEANPDFSKFTYIQMGLWDKRDTLKFYKPINERYVSHTLIENMYSNNYENVEVDSIKNIMKSLDHITIDILKLDIEGSENIVLNKMLDDNIFPRYICVEFDLKIKGVDKDYTTDTIISSLERNGYKLLENLEWNCLFMRI
jgi:FkbM family methyltransferase